MWSDLLTDVNARLLEGERLFNENECSASLAVLKDRGTILQSECWVVSLDVQSSTPLAHLQPSMGEDQVEVAVAARDTQELPDALDYELEKASAKRTSFLHDGFGYEHRDTSPTKLGTTHVPINADVWDAPIWAEDAETLRCDFL